MTWKYRYTVVKKSLTTAENSEKYGKPGKFVGKVE
jgi:hypothetical protein